MKIECELICTMIVCVAGWVSGAILTLLSHDKEWAFLDDVSGDVWIPSADGFPCGMIRSCIPAGMKFHTTGQISLPVARGRCSSLCLSGSVAFG